MDATALLRARESFGLPNATPRPFAAASAAFVRWLNYEWFTDRGFNAGDREMVLFGQGLVA
jgi:hypothetical protein